MTEDEANRAPGHQVYGGATSPTYHLVTASSVALGDWTAICGVPVSPARRAHRWDLGAYCEDCETLAGSAMRAQIAHEEAERGPWGHSPS